MTTLPAERSAAATPALADQWEADALAAIDAVATPEAAEDLLTRVKFAEQAIRLAKLGAEREQRWGRVRLMSERRYGELLGPAERGVNQHTRTSTMEVQRDHKSEHRARAVAAVPEPVFEEYVETAPKPSRAGLLREAPRLAGEPASVDPVKVDVTVQVTKLIAQGAHIDALLSEGGVMQRVDRERADRTLSGITHLRQTLDQLEALVRDAQRIRRVV